MPVSYEIDPKTGKPRRVGSLSATEGQAAAKTAQRPATQPQQPRIGQKAVLNGKSVVWSGPGWGWQSAATYSRTKAAGNLDTQKNPMNWLNNNLLHLLNQSNQLNKGTKLVGNVGFLPIYEEPGGGVSSSTPAQRQVAHAVTAQPVANAGLAAVNLGQRLLSGQPLKPTDPESSSIGRTLVNWNRGVAVGMGAKLPEQMTPDQKSLLTDLPSSLATNAAVAFIPGLTVGPTAFSGLVSKVPYLSKPLQGIIAGGLRWGTNAGANEAVSGLLDDSSQGGAGNLLQAAGLPVPDAFVVDPRRDDRISGGLRSLIPGIAVGELIGAPFGALAKGVELAPNAYRNLREWRTRGEVEAARQQTVNAGVQETVEGTGEYRFTNQPEPVAATPTAAAPTAAAPAPAAEPAAPMTAADAALLQNGPRPGAALEEPAAPAVESAPAAPEQAIDGGEIDPIYEPSLPEIDQPAIALNRLDDDGLRAVQQGEGPVLDRIEGVLQNQQLPEPNPAISTARTAAPSQNLADPVVPYDQQWQTLPTNQLLGAANPAVSPDLFERVQGLTGREWEQFSRQDVLDGLEALRLEGTTVLPNRLQGGGDMYDTNSIAIDPVRFQYKDNVNALGQQKGNSLEGVTKWNPEVEQTNLIWDDPEDGQTYMINGHNSLAKAKELGIPTIPARKILANNAGQARIIGAKANIASGGGTAFDAAKIIRELGIKDAAGLEAAGIPLDSGLGTPGLALSKLPGDLLQQAINGELGMGRALALGGSGLDPADMIRVAQLGVQRNVSERGFAELVQMASSAPKVADADQGGLPGMDEWLKDSSVLEKAELSAKVRAELISDKNLMSRVGKNKAAQKLADKGGTQVNQEQVASAADIARAVLDEFDRDKYLAGTPISELLNQGAADIAAGAKPAVIAKRILQQLEAAAEQAPPVVPKASAPSAGTPEERWAAEPPEKRLARAEEARGLLLSGTKLKNRLDYEAEYKANGDLVSQYLDDSPGSNSGKELTEEQFIAKYGADESTHPQLMHKGGATPKQLKDLREHRYAERYLAWHDQQGLLPAERDAIKAELLNQAVANGEVRPSATPVPPSPEQPSVRLTEGLRDLEQQLGEKGFIEPGTPGAQLLVDEVRLAETYQQRDAVIAQEVGRAQRDAMGYDRLSFEEKKTQAGIAEGWELPPTRQQGNLTAEGASSLDERTALARQQREAAEAAGDQQGAAAWLEEERRLERSRIANAQAGLNTSQQGLFGAGAYDADSPLLNQTTAAPAAVGMTQPAFQLPADLAGAKPRYGYRDLNLEVGFGSDFDLAAYTLAGDVKGQSKRAGAFRVALEAAGFDLKEVIAHGQQVKAALKDAAKGWKPDAANPSRQALELAAQPFSGAQRAAVTVEITPVEPVAPLEIPEAAGIKTTAKTSESRIKGAAESLMSWTRVPGKDPMPLEQALEIVRGKGARLDPDAIPGLDMDAARNDAAMGRSTPATEAVVAAYRQFYGLEPATPAPTTRVQVTATPKVAAIFEELSDALVESDRRTFKKADRLRGLSQRAIKELDAGNPTIALQEATALGESRAAELQAQIQTIKQRANKEGC